MADAIHSSSDVMASLTVFAGLKISKRKSKKFPYGLYKVGNFIHYEPIQKENLIFALPLADDQDKISNHFGEVPYLGFITVRARDKIFINKEILPNPFLSVERGKVILL